MNVNDCKYSRLSSQREDETWGIIAGQISKVGNSVRKIDKNNIRYI